MKDLYNTILDKLGADVTGLAMVDFDLGQLNQEKLPPLNYPAGLMRVDINDLEDEGQFQQRGPVVITMSLVFREYERTHSIVDQEARQRGLAHLDIIAQVKWALHGLAGTTFTRLSHLNTNTVDRADLRVYLMTFGAEIIETPPTPQYVPLSSVTQFETDPELCLEDEDDNSLLQ